MAIDTPARIAIIGAGPIGLEAALYGRFLGYEVDMLERGRVADNIAKWGHVQMFSPWSMNTSPLGIAAIEAQNPDWVCPADNERPTGRKFIEQYLLPLAQSDLLADGLHEQSEVLQIGRAGVLKDDCIGDESFRLLVRGGGDEQRVYHADIVIDASGTFGNHNALGVGGLPAPGEMDNANRIEYGLPDIGGLDREHFAGRHTLVVGRGYSAATNVIALAELAGKYPATRVTWVTRGVDQDAPVRVIDGDQLAAREALARNANAFVTDLNSVVEHFGATSVEQVQYQSAPDRLQVTLVGKHAETIQVDRIIANVGYRPDQSVYSDLQVHACDAIDGPMKLAAAILDNSSKDLLDRIPIGPKMLRNPAPNFYILGSKSYGRDSRFLISTGLEQIRDLFAIIGGRDKLDLYQPPRPKLGQQAGA